MGLPRASSSYLLHVDYGFQCAKCQIQPGSYLDSDYSEPRSVQACRHVASRPNHEGQSWVIQAHGVISHQSLDLVWPQPKGVGRAATILDCLQTSCIMRVSWHHWTLVQSLIEPMHMSLTVLDKELACFKPHHVMGGWMIPIKLLQFSVLWWNTWRLTPGKTRSKRNHKADGHLGRVFAIFQRLLRKALSKFLSALLLVGGAAHGNSIGRNVLKPIQNNLSSRISRSPKRALHQGSEDV